MKTPSAPLVSVIIPARLDTPEKVGFFYECLASLDQQTLRTFEVVICIDGGPLPDTPRVNVPIRWRFHGVSLGASAARNTAALHANGEYLLPLDADDVLPFDALATLLEHADPHTFVYGDVELFGDRTGVHRLPPYRKAEMLRLTGAAPVTALHSRAAWLAVGGWDASLSALEDTEYYLRLIEAGYTGVHLDQVTLRYRKHANSRQATAESGKDTLARLQATIREKHPMLYNEASEMPEKPCSTCPGAGKVMEGLKMDVEGLQNPIEVRYEGPNGGSTTVRSWDDPRREYRVPERGGTFLIDERDRDQFAQQPTQYGQQAYRLLPIKADPPQA